MPVQYIALAYVLTYMYHTQVLTPIAYNQSSSPIHTTTRILNYKSNLSFPLFSIRPQKKKIPWKDY